MHKKKNIIFLCGPTAVGKSKVAVEICRRIGAEIISCDSMQVYRRMDIITSKPEQALMKKARHHLIGTVSPQSDYDVSKYRKQAMARAAEIFARGRIPLFTGGTGLYMSVIIDGIFKEGAWDEKIRARLYDEIKRYGTSQLYNRLKKIDPQAAAKIHQNDARRIGRALEVYQATGTPISSLQKQRSGLGGEYVVKAFCLDIPRQQLYRRINERVEGMFSAGLVDEVKRLLKKPLSKTASSAIGIKELKGYFDGEYGLDTARELIKRNSRRYAKRQLSWFRRDKRIIWIKSGDKETPRKIAGRIIKRINPMKRRQVRG